MSREIKGLLVIAGLLWSGWSPEHFLATLYVLGVITLIRVIAPWPDLADLHPEEIEGLR